MPHSYTNLLAHVVYSTKERRPEIDERLEQRLFPYSAGIVRQVGGRLYAINGDSDHVHLLIEVPAATAVAEIVGKLKGSSSKWIHETFPEKRRFAWQRGYGAFSVSRSNVPAVARYIEAQKIHHRKVAFKDELLSLLRKHGVSFDERYIWM